MRWCPLCGEGCTRQQAEVEAPRRKKQYHTSPDGKKQVMWIDDKVRYLICPNCGWNLKEKIDDLALQEARQ